MLSEESVAKDGSIVYIARNIHYTSPQCWMKGAPITIRGVFNSAEQAIRWCLCEAMLVMPPIDWSTFPNPKLHYPYEERDGSNRGLTPLFVLKRSNDSGERWEIGVEKMVVRGAFDYGAPNAMAYVDEVWGKLYGKDVGIKMKEDNI